MKQILFILAAVFFMNSAYSQNEKIKAVFIYNFTKYIEWSGTNDVFTIGILNSKAMNKQLSAIARRKKVGTKKIIIKNFKNVYNIKKCEIIYIPKSQASKIKIVKSRNKNNNMLIISDECDGIKKGAGINFVVKKNRQRFEIRRRNIERNGVKLNSRLLSLGIVK